MSLLNKLTSIVSDSKKRVGRGYGSGKGGHTSGRGAKGQKARSTNLPLWFEGGQLPLVRRLPKWRGKGRFKSLEPTAEITLSDLEKMKAEKITLESLKKEKIIDPRFKKAKIIKTGQLKRAVTIEDVQFSAGAAKAIKKAGGSVK